LAPFKGGFYVSHFVKGLGICLKESENMGIAFPGLAFAQQIYVSLKAHGEDNLGTQALILDN
jgi:3-hydroxyisobutyrate dehydrogenase-like beta-hydroxyacid dehydrogenase